MRLTAIVTATTVALLSSQAVSAFAASPSPSLRSPLKPFSRHHLSFPRREPGNDSLTKMMAVSRGGDAVVSFLASKVVAVTRNPSSLFNSALVSLALTTAVIKVIQKSSQQTTVASTSDPENTTIISKPKSITSLQMRYLSVFWLIRCADWLQGPYFYEVYASKVFGGMQASMGLVSKLFLTGFASTALFGPLVGSAADTYGRKRGTLAFCLIYAIGAASTKSPLLSILLLGRVFSGIGTSLLFSAPESWLVGESQKSGDDPEGKYLGETFGMVRVCTHWMTKIPHCHFVSFAYLEQINNLTPYCIRTYVHDRRMQATPLWPS
jgi:hypothetical protein